MLRLTGAHHLRYVPPASLTSMAAHSQPSTESAVASTRHISVSAKGQSADISVGVPKTFVGMSALTIHEAPFLLCTTTFTFPPIEEPRVPVVYRTVTTAASYERKQQKRQNSKETHIGDKNRSVGGE